MKLLYLFVDWFVKEGEPDRESYGIVFGTDKHHQFVKVEYEEWYEVLKELSRQRLIVDRKGISTTPYTYRMRYFLEPIKP